MVVLEDVPEWGEWGGEIQEEGNGGEWIGEWRVDWGMDWGGLGWW